MTTIARWVSILAHPFVMVALLIAVPAARQSSRTAIESALVVTVAVIVPMAVLMFGQVRRGRWSNVDASKPSERPLLFVVALAGLVAALGWVFSTTRSRSSCAACSSWRHFFSSPRS